MTWRTSDVAVCCSSDFSKFPRAQLLRLKQPGVFNRDHRLIGEGLSQFDLLVHKRTYGFALQE
jgi:hypothetical protein